MITRKTASIKRHSANVKDLIRCHVANSISKVHLLLEELIDVATGKCIWCNIKDMILKNCD